MTEIAFFASLSYRLIHSDPWQWRRWTSSDYGRMEGSFRMNICIGYECRIWHWHWLLLSGRSSCPGSESVGASNHSCLIALGLDAPLNKSKSQYTYDFIQTLTIWKVNTFKFPSRKRETLNTHIVLKVPALSAIRWRLTGSVHFHHVEVRFADIPVRKHKTDLMRLLRALFDEIRNTLVL